jgi:hypothetical protein
MAIVGAGVVIAVTMPFTAPATSQTAHSWDSTVGAGRITPYYVPAAPSTSAAIRFNWSSSNSTEVNWYAAGPCSPAPSWCIEGGPIASWPGNTSGSWSGTGPAGSGYCILVNDHGSVSVNFSGEFIESVRSSTHPLPMVPFAIVLSGGSILIGIGGLSIYLGLFLPAGTYRPRGSTPTDDPEAYADSPDETVVDPPE